VLFCASGILLVLGIELKLLGEDLWLAVAVPGIALFVLAACLVSGAGRGGHVGHPDINPWTVGK
jgi:hypothetical protein